MVDTVLTAASRRYERMAPAGTNRPSTIEIPAAVPGVGSADGRPAPTSAGSQEDHPMQPQAPRPRSPIRLPRLVAGEWRCLDCHRLSYGDSPAPRCPNCHGTVLRPTVDRPSLAATAATLAAR
jgi:hypothetical protein